MELIVTDFMTLDGVVQAPGGPEEDTDGGFAHGGWSHPYFDVDVMGPVIGGLLEGSDALLFGRRTWQGMAAAWPGRAGDPYADGMNAITKYVASSTLSQDDVAAWNNSHVLDPADPIEAIRKLREADGRIMHVWGSPTLSRQLIEHDLVDQYVLFLEPLLVGGGKRLWPQDGAARKLELVSAVPASTGTIVCTYKAAS